MMHYGPNYRKHTYGRTGYCEKILLFLKYILYIYKHTNKHPIPQAASIKVQPNFNESVKVVKFHIQTIAKYLFVQVQSASLCTSHLQRQYKGYMGQHDYIQFN